MAARSLDSLIERMPFSIKAIQVEGGLEFRYVFEEQCQSRNIELFALASRSPKLNSTVERAHTEAFYGIMDANFET